MLKELEKPDTGQRIARPEPGPSSFARIDLALLKSSSCKLVSGRLGTAKIFSHGAMISPSLPTPDRMNMDEHIAQERVASQMLEDKKATQFFVARLKLQEACDCWRTCLYNDASCTKPRKAVRAPKPFSWTTMAPCENSRPGPRDLSDLKANRFSR